MWREWCYATTDFVLHDLVPLISYSTNVELYEKEGNCVLMDYGEYATKPYQVKHNSFVIWQGYLDLDGGYGGVGWIQISQDGTNYKDIGRVRRGSSGSGAHARPGAMDDTEDFFFLPFAAGTYVRIRYNIRKSHGGTDYIYIAELWN